MHYLIHFQNLFENQLENDWMRDALSISHA